MKASRFLACSILSLFAANISFAASFPPTDDTTSRAQKLTVASGKSSVAYVDAHRNTLLAFDISSLGLTHSSQIRYARLRLFFPRVTTAGGGLNVSMATSPWDEMTAGSEPTFATPAVTTIPANALVTRHFGSVDVTAAVAAWIDNTTPNNGFIITPAGGANVTVGTKEGTGNAYAAELEIELADDALAPGSIDGSLLAPNLTLAGTTNGTFAGSGAALTTLTAANIAGQLGSPQLAPNLTLGGTTSGTFAGSGAGLTGLSTANLTGLILSPQLAPDLTLGGTTNGYFTGSFGGTFNGAFFGDGTAIINLRAVNITGQIGTSQIADGAITAAKLAADAGLWTTNGTDVYRTTGNVGIGTSTPNFPLEVKETNAANSDPVAVLNHAGIGAGINVQLTNTSNGSRGVDVNQNGVGPGVFAMAQGGNAVWGITNSVSAAGVIGDNHTGGESVVGRTSHPDPAHPGNGVGAVVGRNDMMGGYGVRGFTTSTGGIGVLGQAGISGSTGTGGRFENVNAANSGDALQGVTNGPGWAANFTNVNNSSASKAVRISTTAGQGGNALNVANGTVAMSYQHPYASNTVVDDATLVVTTAGNVTIPTGPPLVDGAQIYVVNNTGAVVTVTNTTVGTFNINPGRAVQLLFITTISSTNWIPVQP